MRQDRNLLNGSFKQTDRHSLTSKIFAFLLCAGLLFGMSPMSVLAEIKGILLSGESLDELTSDDTLVINHGTIKTNNGSVEFNGTDDDRQGTVTTNNGHIENNHGTVTTNEGTITTNNGTVTTNNGKITTNNGTISSNYGDVSGGTIEYMYAGTATECGIALEIKDGTAIDCNIGIMSGGTATNCNITYMTDGTAAGGRIATMDDDGKATKATIVYMAGGTATECAIAVEMINGTAIDSTIKKMTGGTARGANTVIKDYQGGDVSELVPLANIKKADGSSVTEENVKRVEAIPSEMSGGGSTPSGGAVVSTPEPVIPESPYRVFLFDTVPQVKNAAQGATLKLELDAWNALPLWFMKEIAARGDLTIHLTYIYERKTYDVTFPAGMVIAFDEKIPYYGPLKLADMAMRGGGICNITQ